jgi:hypothetical protein
MKRIDKRIGDHDAVYSSSISTAKNSTEVAWFFDSLQNGEQRIGFSPDFSLKIFE